MHRIIEKHGKQIIDETMDMLLIKGKPLDNEQARQWLLKHGIIKRGTKTVRMNMNIYKPVRGYYQHPIHGRQWGEIPEEQKITTYSLWCNNGRNSQIFQVSFDSTELPQIMEDLASSEE